MTQRIREPFKRLVELLSEDMGFFFQEKEEFERQAEKSDDMEILMVTMQIRRESEENERFDEVLELNSIINEMVEGMGL